MLKNPETYKELIQVNNILKITEYYNVSQDFIEEAYNFILSDSSNLIECSIDKIFFKDKSYDIVKTFDVTMKVAYKIDGLIIYDQYIEIINRYVSSGGSSGYGGMSYGGSSSNNNNNNN